MARQVPSLQVHEASRAKTQGRRWLSSLRPSLPQVPSPRHHESQHFVATTPTSLRPRCCNSSLPQRAQPPPWCGFRLHKIISDSDDLRDSIACLFANSSAVVGGTPRVNLSTVAGVKAFVRSRPASSQTTTLASGKNRCICNRAGAGQWTT